MTIASEYHELDELGGGRFRHTQHLKQIAYRDAGVLRRIVPDWIDSGISERPHIVTASRMMVSVADDGMRRIHPTREADRYMEIGTPYVKVGGVWRKVGFTGATRTANSIAWHRPQADLRITHGGHFIKLDIELLGGYVPEDNLIAFPVGLSGLTRSGTHILADSAAVATLRQPVVTDAANTDDVREIGYQFTSLAGQPYLVMTLPTLTGMTRPVIDPTLTLQPAAAAGIDCMIISGLPDYNTGINSNMAVGKRNHTGQNYRSLLKFDVSGIASSATCTSATLYLTPTGDNADTTSTLYVYRMLRAWAEGTIEYSNVGVDGATWNTYDGSNAWGTAGASNTSSDREASDIGSRSMSASETLNTAFDISLTAASVQDWWDGGLTNNGILLQNSENSYDHYFYAPSDSATASYRPKLVIEYTTVGSPWYAYAQQ